MKPSRSWLPTGVAGMPVLSRRRSATGPASFGPHPGQMGGSYCTRSSKSVRGLGGTGTPKELRTPAATGSDDRLLVGGRMDFAVHRQHRDRDFQHDGIDVVAAHGVGSLIVGIVSID